MATPLERARGGSIAVSVFASQRATQEPFTIEGWIALALSAVDGYARFHKDPSFQEQAEGSMADALSTLGETATDVLHYMDGKEKAADLYNRALRIAATGLWEPIPYAEEDAEAANSAALLAALSLACSAMWDDTSSTEMLAGVYQRFTTEAEETRLVFARRVRRLVENDAPRRQARRQAN
ncbi:hypothetical protein [Streptomyces chartreusis]|uniref:hypothetical protein n=1 Tax=Streptomyces chartreusis TaxID=1969 RepID=UPI0016773B2E|nr:hypothetical protein [Streptomyces chartreusis]GGX55932.1 hypothetical protein GCM10010321_86480 [Streptomyces chartreusis]